MALFEPYGPLGPVNVVKDKMTGKSRGFAFVDVADEKAAEAISTLNGRDVDGRQIAVSEARPMKDNGGGRSGGFGGGRGGPRREGGFRGGNGGGKFERGGYR